MNNSKEADENDDVPRKFPTLRSMIRSNEDKLRELEDKYTQMEVNMNNDELISTASSSLSIPHPLHTVDTRNKYSVLKAYNSGVSEGYVDSLVNRAKNRLKSWDELKRELDESARKGREKDNKRIEEHNAAWKRIDEFDRKFKEREAFSNRILRLCSKPGCGNWKCWRCGEEFKKEWEIVEVRGVDKHYSQYVLSICSSVLEGEIVKHKFKSRLENTEEYMRERWFNPIPSTNRLREDVQTT
jgi:hypothetical protein